MKDILNCQSSINDITEPYLKFKEAKDKIEYQEKLLGQWKAMSKEEQSKYNKQIGKFYSENGFGKEDVSEKNYRLMESESIKRIVEESELKYMSLGGMNDNQSIMDLLNMIENVDHIKRIYKLRKKNLESILEGEVTVTGISFVMKHKISSLKDLFNWMKKAKKEEQPANQQPNVETDSTTVPATTNSQQ